jgi:hypothetical protein
LEVTLIDAQSSFKVVCSVGSLGAHVAQLPGGSARLALSMSVIETDTAAYTVPQLVKATA